MLKGEREKECVRTRSVAKCKTRRGGCGLTYGRSSVCTATECIVHASRMPSPRQAYVKGE